MARLLLLMIAVGLVASPASATSFLFTAEGHVTQFVSTLNGGPIPDDFSLIRINDPIVMSATVEIKKAESIRQTGATFDRILTGVSYSFGSVSGVAGDGGGGSIMLGFGGASSFSLSTRNLSTPTDSNGQLAVRFSEQLCCGQLGLLRSYDLYEALTSDLLAFPTNRISLSGLLFDSPSTAGIDLITVLGVVDRTTVREVGSAVPEPGSFALVGAGLIALLRRQSRGGQARQNQG